jgi:hypothetical protein
MMRSIFDAGKAGMVLIGMPGIEKRIAGFPQFYSRIGFVHEFRTLEEKEITELLNQGWGPVGVTLPNEMLGARRDRQFDTNEWRELPTTDPPLTQIERILKVNQLDRVSKEIVAATRDSLVIGQV